MLDRFPTEMPCVDVSRVDVSLPIVKPQHVNQSTYKSTIK